MNELLTRFPMLKPVNKCYKLNIIACSGGHIVIHLLLDMCTYSPTELIWSQIKCEVAGKNKHFKMVGIEQLLNSALETISDSGSPVFSMQRRYRMKILQRKLHRPMN
jgi:hypothetical protein